MSWLHLLSRVFYTSELAWEEYDRPHALGLEFRLLQGALGRWSTYAGNRREKRESKVLEEVREGWRRGAANVAMVPWCWSPQLAPEV